MVSNNWKIPANISSFVADESFIDAVLASKFSSSFKFIVLLSNLEEELELEAAASSTLFLMVVDIVELLADFSTPPDTNDVLDDEMEIGQCCYKRN